MVSFKERLAAIDARMRERLADPGHEAWVRKREAELAEDGRVQVEHRRKAAGIPAAMRPHIDDPWASLAAAGHTQPQDRAAFDFARDWLDSHKPIAILAGDLGRGKSTAMAWAVDQRRGGVYLDARDVARSGWYGDAYWDAWVMAPILGLDELGMEPMDEKGWWESKLAFLLSLRLNENRRTLVGTNLSKADLKARYGSNAMQRLWDRLEAAWAGRVFVGPSLRHAPSRKAVGA